MRSVVEKEEEEWSSGDRAPIKSLVRTSGSGVTPNGLYLRSPRLKRLSLKRTFVSAGLGF